MIPLKYYRSKAEGFADLLNYGHFVDRGILYCKDGSFMVGYFYRGADLSGADNELINRTHTYINQALSIFDGSWTIKFDMIRKDIENPDDLWKSPVFDEKTIPLIKKDKLAQALYTPSDFDNGASGFIEKKMMMADRFYKNTHTIFLSWIPPSAQEQKLVSFFNRENSQDSGKLLEHFYKQLDEFENLFSIALTLKRMENRDMLTSLNTCISDFHNKLNAPDYPLSEKFPPFVDLFLGCIFEPGYMPRVGGRIDGRFVCAIYIDGFPEYIVPAMLSHLDTHKISYRVSHRFICLDNLKAQKMIKKFRRKWRQSVQGIVGSLIDTRKKNNFALAMAQDTEESMMLSQSGELYGLYTPIVIIWDKDKKELIRKAAIVKKGLAEREFRCGIEDLNTTEAYLGSLPGNTVADIRKSMISVDVLSAMISISCPWTGEETCPSPLFPKNSPPLLTARGVGNNPFRLNLHVSDVGHTLIFGPTGAGKSTFLAVIASQFKKYSESNIFMFDQGHSLFPITLAVGGDHYDLGDSKRLHFCPFGQIGKTDVAWAIEWLASMVELQDNKPVNSGERKNLKDALDLMLDADSDKRFKNLVSKIQSERLKTALHPYEDSLFDHESDKLSVNKFLCFEMEEVMKMGEKFVIPLLLYLFKRIEDKLDGKPSLIILDEAWIMLGHPVFREKIREWLKTLRKKNCAVVMATQSLSDATRSGIMDVLSESCPTKIFLPNRSAKEINSKQAYESMNLNGRQLDIIASAMPKRDYYYISPLGSKLFSLNLKKPVLSLIASTSTEDIKTIKELQQKNPKDWIEKFLTGKGIDYEDFKDIAM